MGGVGRACGAVKATSGYETKLKAAITIPSDQTRQSYLVKAIINTYFPDATAFESMLTEFNGHTAVSDFNSAAAGLGLQSISIAYRGTTNSFSYGLQLYMLAKIAIAKGLAGTPYDTALASWTVAEVGELVADLAAA